MEYVKKLETNLRQHRLGSRCRQAARPHIAPLWTTSNWIWRRMNTDRTTRSHDDAEAHTACACGRCNQIDVTVMVLSNDDDRQWLSTGCTELFLSQFPVACCSVLCPVTYACHVRVSWRCSVCGQRYFVKKTVIVLGINEYPKYPPKKRQIFPLGWKTSAAILASYTHCRGLRYTQCGRKSSFLKFFCRFLRHGLELYQKIKIFIQRFYLYCQVK